jgi:hypothetical protein
MRGSGGAAAALRGSARLRWLVIVIAIMAVLTAGWPLLNRAVTDRQRLAANSRLVVGPSEKNSATVTVGPGWQLRAGETNPRLMYLLQRGPAMMTIAYASLVNNRQVSDLWAGMREVVEFHHPGATLSGPLPIRSVHGATGEFGRIKGLDMVGTAAVFAGPSHRYAVEMLIVIPRGSPQRNLLAARRIMLSVLFPWARLS